MKNSEKLLNFFTLPHNFKGCAKCINWSDVNACAVSWCQAGFAGKQLVMKPLYSGWGWNEEQRVKYAKGINLKVRETR